MSLLYHITLLYLKADVSAPDPACEKLELGAFSAREMFKLAGQLQKLNAPPGPNQPALIIRHNTQGWRIVAHDGQLRVHHGASPFEDYWTVRDASGLATLRPFADAAAEEDSEDRAGALGWIGSGLKVVGLMVLGVSLMAVSLWFGLPRHKLRAIPPDLVVLSSDQEIETAFNSLAGTYVSGRHLGDLAVTISPQGEVSLGSIGKDGKVIHPPRVEEKARAGRRQNLTCVITSFGIFASGDPDTVTIGSAHWRRAPVN
ncbi:MAG: hypothetical protein ACHQ5A_06335 [Opitutales bacterium]